MIFNGVVEQSIISGGTTPASTFKDVVISNVSAAVSLSTDAIKIDGTLTIDNGAVLDLEGQDLTLAALDNNGTLRLMGRETVTIASGMDADSGTVCYDGTETYSNGLAAGDTYYDLAFTGVGGTWVFIDPLLINGDLFVGAGTFSGGYSVTVKGGDVTGDGTINLSGGTFNLRGASDPAKGFGGATDWTFSSLTFGDGSTAASTSKTGINVITVTDKLTISASHELKAGSSATWNFSWNAVYLTDVIRISAGYYHSLALKSDGTAWAWGDNDNGQLGDGTTDQRLTPVQVDTSELFVSISAGGFHSLALKADGTVWGWGNNDYGQLGDGTTDQRLTPVQTNTSEVFTAISAGGFHSLALKSDGTAWAWGDNGNGQLGDGTTDQRLTQSPKYIRSIHLGLGGGSILSP